MFIKTLRILLLVIILTIILFSFVVFYFYKNILNHEIIKYNLIAVLKLKYNITSNLGKIKYIRPDLFIIESASFSSPSVVIKAEKIETNINLTEAIISKKLRFKPDSIKIHGMSLKYDLSQTNKKYELVDILKKIKDLIKKVEVLSSSLYIEDKNIKVKIDRLTVSNSFFSNNTKISFEGEYYQGLQKLRIKTFFDIEDNEIKIKDLSIQINGKNLEMSGNIAVYENVKGDIKLMVKNPIDIKEIVNIPYSIKIQPFQANILSVFKNNTINFFSSIPSIKTEVNINFDTDKKVFSEINIKAKELDAGLFKEYIKEYAKNFKGKINITVEIKPPSHTYSITAESQKFDFIDLLNAINFKDSVGKIIITDKFYALNLIRVSGLFPYGKIEGNIRIEGKKDYQKINFNTKLNLNTLNGYIAIKNLDKSELTAYDLFIKTQNFSLKKALDIIEYFREKASKHHSLSNSPYNFTNRRMNIHIESDGYSDEPYISANKLLSSIKYSKTNNILKCEGEIRIKLLNGQIKNITENTKENENYRLILLPLTTLYNLNRTGALRMNYELKNINFYDMGSSFKLNNGKIIIDKFYLNSVEFLVYTRGEIDLNSRKLNMSVYTINRKYYNEGVLPEYLTDSKGRPAIAFTITGSFDKNSIKLIDATNITKFVEDEVKTSIDIN